jgi:hypothetical protein
VILLEKKPITVMLLTVELLVKIPIMSRITDSKITKIEHSPPSSMNEKGKVMAVVAMAKYGHAHHHKSSKKATKEKLIRVLLDSGSDGDLLFHEKGNPNTSPT